MRVDANLPGISTVTGQFLLQMHKNDMFELENEGQSYGSQQPQRRHSRANTKAIKDITNFCAIFHRFRDIIISIFDLDNVGHRHGF